MAYTGVKRRSHAELDNDGNEGDEGDEGGSQNEDSGSSSSSATCTAGASASAFTAARDAHVRAYAESFDILCDPTREDNIDTRVRLPIPAPILPPQEDLFCELEA